jgi:hypothetical protein
MKKSATIQEFITLISNMAHRERFVFKANLSDNDNKEIEYVEIYTTELLEKSNFNTGLDRNIKVSFNDILGKQLPGKQYCINKYLRLWTPKFFETVYNFIA